MNGRKFTITIRNEEGKVLGEHEYVIKEENMNRCYLCGGIATDRHHMLNGLAYRQKAEKYGLVVNLCRRCHDEVHFGKRSRELSDRLRKEAQLMFERKYPELDFTKIFRINYLDEEDRKEDSIDLCLEDKT